MNAPPVPNTGTNKGGAGGLAKPLISLVIFIAVVVGLYYLYKFLYGSSASQASVSLLSGVKSATETIRDSASSSNAVSVSALKGIADGGQYSVSFWLYVASTKAFTAQLTVLAMMAMKIGKEKGTLSAEEYNRYLAELAQIPAKVERTLATHEQVKAVAAHYAEARDFLFLGRGYNFPVALEGALKLKEISYIHAEGYPAAEMKHGPIALVDENLPVLFIATQDAYYEKIVSNIQEIKARKGKVIAVVTEGDTLISSMADHVLEVPAVDELLAPLLSVLPTQLLSYYIGVLRGLDVDKPKNLAKSVTVE
jgi:glucosamine--fructose-6-phosphate aminotransferase (isomerizing)